MFCMTVFILVVLYSSFILAYLLYNYVIRLHSLATEIKICQPKGIDSKLQILKGDITRIAQRNYRIKNLFA